MANKPTTRERTSVLRNKTLQNSLKVNAAFTKGGIFLFVQHERILTGESPQRALIAGSVQPKARVSVVRRNLKEAGGKHLA